ncbi:MAG: hypothetical protein ACP5JE_05980 [Thermoplasmata archaeon]
MFMHIKYGHVCRINPQIETFLSKLDSALNNLLNLKDKLYLISAIRTPDEQLSIIRSLVEINKLTGLNLLCMVYPAEKKLTLRGVELYTWQLPWSWLISKNMWVSPPYDAELISDFNLMPTKRNGMISQSPHIKGHAVDFKFNQNAFEVLKKIQASSNLIKLLKIEHNNDTIHLEF